MPKLVRSGVNPVRFGSDWVGSRKRVPLDEGSLAGGAVFRGGAVTATAVVFGRMSRRGFKKFRLCSKFLLVAEAGTRRVARGAPMNNRQAARV